MRHNNRTTLYLLALGLAAFGGVPVVDAQAAIGENIHRVAGELNPAARKPTSDMSNLESVMRESSKLAPSGAGLELNEISEPRDLLIDSDYMRKLLGTEPTFVYASGETQDPMIVPWTRARVLTGELLKLAERAKAAKNWTLAEELYQRVIQIADSLGGVGLRVPSIDENRGIAQDGIREVGMLQETQSSTGEMAKRKVYKLPAWVQNNTIGIVYHPIEPFCLVGPSILRVGDIVPRQKVEVIVEKITNDAVHYRIQDQVFVVYLAEKETE